MSHTATITNPAAAAAAIPAGVLFDAAREGTCPGCGGVYGLTEGDRVPGHPVAGARPGRPACRSAGRRARNPQRRPHFYVEGVRYL